MLTTETADPILPIRQLSDGRFAAITSGRDQVGIWSSDGKVVTLFGRTGPGPGELRRATSIYVDKDTIFVADQGLEVEVFDSFGTWVRGMYRSGIQHYESAAILDSGDFLVAPPHHMSGDAFAIVDRADGKHVREAGKSRPRAENVRQEVRAIAYNGGDTFWLATTEGYRLELWGIDGKMRASIVRDVSWFPEPSPAQVTGKAVRPYVATFALDEQSILWVAVLFPVEQRTLGAAGADIDVKDAYDLHVEAFDGASGSLLYSERLDDPYAFMPPPLLTSGRGIRIRPDDDGILNVNIVEYKLVARN